MPRFPQVRTASIISCAVRLSLTCAMSRGAHGRASADGSIALFGGDLRHSCTSLLLAQGVSPKTGMATLRHSQISLTLDA